MKIEKGRTIILVDENNNPTNFDLNLDIERELNIGDIFVWMPKRDAQKLKVVNIDNVALFCQEIE